MLFDPRESIDFNGNTGPFIQYTHARIRSVLRKAQEAGIACGEASAAAYLPEEVALVKQLADYPNVVKAAAENFAPSIVAAYAPMSWPNNTTPTTTITRSCARKTLRCVPCGCVCRSRWRA